MSAVWDAISGFVWDQLQAQAVTLGAYDHGGAECGEGAQWAESADPTWVGAPLCAVGEGE